MRVTEAAWIARVLAALPLAERGPVLNVGSSTAAFREGKQPHIDQLIFAPLRAAGIPVIHADLKPEPGVDVAGDLQDRAVQDVLRAHCARVVICSNMLEHVVEPAAFARILAALPLPGSHLIVTVPRSYPYHPDPIDTGFRPTPAELVGLFPGCTEVRAEIVEDGTLVEELVGRGARGLVQAARLGLGALRPLHPLGRIYRGRLPWLVRRFSATCIVVRTPG